jgi:DnaJ like chaperone protein
MSWWGKLLGGAFGFMLGGPLGALIGAALGHNFDKGMDGLDDMLEDGGEAPDDRERVQMAFFTATFAVMGHVAKADGAVSRDEIRMAESVMEDWQLSADMRSAAIKLFNEGKQPNFPIEAVIDQFRRECGRRTNLMRLFVEIQLQGAYADGELHPKEEELLLRVCKLLGFPETEFRHMQALARASMGGRSHGQRGSWQGERASGWRQRDSGTGQSGQQSGGQRQRRPAGGERMTVAQAYQILGIGPQASDGDVKKAYRRAMSQHHPDKLVAKGLPEEMVKAATEKTAQIRRAYEQIKALRGI